MNVSEIRKTILTIAAAVAAGVALMNVPEASAHHSFTMFDMDRTIMIEGEVTRFEWTNPHTFTFVNVENEEGVVQEWGLEGMSPNYLGRRGWSRHSLEPGDHVVAEINPLKEGFGGTVRWLLKDDGTCLQNFGPCSQGGNAKGKGK